MANVARADVADGVAGGVTRTSSGENIRVFRAEPGRAGSPIDVVHVMIVAAVEDDEIVRRRFHVSERITIRLPCFGKRAEIEDRWLAVRIREQILHVTVAVAIDDAGRGPDGCSGRYASRFRCADRNTALERALDVGALDSDRPAVKIELPVMVVPEVRVSLETRAAN